MRKTKKQAGISTRHKPSVIAKSKTAGLTLIALAITIIILLILAGISIGVLAGENGLIKQSQNAKTQTEIAEEKEILDTATVKAMAKDRYGNLIQENLQEALDKIAGEGKAEVADAGENLEVCFLESKRYYEVDQDGNVGNYQEIIEDKTPGDITKDKEGNTLAGTQENPYEIWCIEDLVEFSNKVNNGSTYKGLYIELKRDLNFKSTFSYNDYKAKEYGDINGDTIIEDLKTELTKTEEECSGFIPIGISSNIGFAGIFNGNDKTIKNIYIKNTSAGLFICKSFYETTIKNLRVTGKIVATGDNGAAGGICSVFYRGVIENCHNYASIYALGKSSYTGGIIGTLYDRNNGQASINNCKNIGNISGNATTIGWSGTGGIIGYIYGSNPIIMNCYNEGKINDQIQSGGIIGENVFTTTIYNCYNAGKIIADENQTSLSGGIVGYLCWNKISIINCYNVGTLRGKSIGGIIGSGNISYELLTVNSTYFLNAIADEGMSNKTIEASSLSEEELKSKNFVDTLNEFIEISTEIDTSNWNKWKYVENEYPSLQ